MIIYTLICSNKSNNQLLSPILLSNIGKSIVIGFAIFLLFNSKIIIKNMNKYIDYKRSKTKINTNAEDI